MTNLIMAWVTAHQQFFQGLLVGWAATHPAQIMRIIWQNAVKIPGVRQVLLSNPTGTKAFAQAMLDEFDKDVDEAAKEDIPKVEEVKK